MVIGCISLNFDILLQITIDIKGLVLHTNGDLVVCFGIFHISADYNKFLRVGITYQWWFGCISLYFQYFLRLGAWYYIQKVIWLYFIACLIFLDITLDIWRLVLHTSGDLITVDISWLLLHTNRDLVVFLCISSISEDYIRYLRVVIAYEWWFGCLSLYLLYFQRLE